MRQVVQIIRCDECKVEVEEDLVETFTLTFNKDTVEFELCPGCSTGVHHSTLGELLELGTPVRRAIKKPKAKKQMDAADSDLPHCFVFDKKSNHWRCTEHGTTHPTAGGARTHFTRKHMVE